MKTEDICCCCLSDSCYKDVNKAYLHHGKAEIYGVMLSNTFGVSVIGILAFISVSELVLPFNVAMLPAFWALKLLLKRKLICEKCIVKLREAAEFKQQIITADLSLIAQSKQLVDDNDDQEVEVKVEPEEIEIPPEKDQVVSDDGSMNTADAEESPERNGQIEIKEKINVKKKFKSLFGTQEPKHKCSVHGCKNRGNHRLPRNEYSRKKWIEALEHESQNKKIAKSARICSAHFPASDFVLTPTMIHNFHKVRASLKKSAVPRLFPWNPNPEDQPRNVKFQRVTHEGNPDYTQETISFDPTKLKSTYARKKSRVLKGPTKNTVQLISNSNLCIFKPFQNNTEYACYLCKETYTNIKELREHSKQHELSEFLTRIRALQGMTCRHVDISNLSCLCTHPCEDLDGLTTHLTEKHEIQFENGGHLLIPYKLQDGFQCVICKKGFNTFYRLTTHMNCHSTTNVCDICGTAYFSRLYLRQHVKAQHRESTCRICLAKFPTATELAQHSRKVHKKIPKREYRCKECNLIFIYAYKLKDHMVLSHGMPEIKVDCNICGKTLKNDLCLRTHKRCVHDKERRFQCTLCDLRFFTKFDRVRHEKTHLDKCMFDCDYCETKFKSKDSLRRHMKKQHTVI